MQALSIISRARGKDARQEEVVDRFGGVVEGGEDSHDGAPVGRFGDEAQGDFGDDAEGAFGAGEKLGKVVAGLHLDHLAAGAGDATVGEDDLEGEDVVAGGAVLEAAWATGGGGDVATDGALAQGLGVGRVEEGVLFDLGLEVGGDDAGLDGGGHVGGVDFEEAVHAGEVDDEATLSGNGTASEAGAAAARNDGDAEAGGDFDGGGDFFGGEGGDDGVGLAEGPGAVVGVDGEVFGGGLEAVGGESGAQAVDQ